MAVGGATLIAGRYQVLGKLGSGTYGEVWKARDLHQDQVVAVKLLKPLAGVWPWDEAARLTALRSTHILPVWNADVVAGVPFIVTEVAARGTLEDLARKSTPLVVDALRFTRHAARGLARTHDARIVHRDIKGENLFVDDAGRVLVGDYGLAHPMDARGEAPGTGTPITIAPEVITHGVCSAASDIYSLGATAYRVLTGCYPHLDKSPVDPADLERLITTEEATPLRDLAPYVSRAVAARVARAMARDPADRYQSVAEFDSGLGELPRPNTDWLPVAPHPGHLRCWSSYGRTPTVRVCIAQGSTAARFNIEVVHEPSGRRMRRLCVDDVARGGIGGRVRATFETLGN